MSKKISLITIISLAIVLSSTFIFAQGPKPIFQQVFDTDNESHPTGEITFNVWIASRPDWVLNENSTGSLVQMDATNTRFLVSFNAGNFPGLGAPVDWTAGEIIHLEVYREATEHVAIVEFPISAGGSGQFRYRREDSDESIYLREYPDILFDSNEIADYRVGTNATLVADYDPDENGLYRAIDWMQAGRYWQIEFSTEGYEELSFTSKVRRQFVGGTPANRRYGPKHFTTLFSIDGEEWIPVGNPNEDDGFFWWELPDSDEWMNMAFALPEACENQRQVWVRWLHLEDWFEIVNNAFGEIKDVKVTGYGEGEPPLPENPDIARNPNPANNATNVLVTLETLRWSYIIDEDFANPVGFRVYITDEEFDDEYVWVDFDEEVANYHTNVPVDLDYETTYLWKVVPTTIYGGGRSISRRTRNSAVRESLLSRQDGPTRVTRSSTMRETYSQSFRGDAVNVPVWRFTTEEADAPRYSVEIVVHPLRGGTTNPIPGTYWFAEGDTVRAGALPAFGYDFVSWEIWVGDERVEVFETADVVTRMIPANLRALVHFELQNVYDGDQELEGDEDNPGNDYVGTGFRFSPDDAEDEITRLRVLWTNDPNAPSLRLFGNRGAIGKYWRFLVSNPGVFRNGVLHLYFPMQPEPFHIYYRSGTGRWVSIPFVWVIDQANEPPQWNYALINLSDLPGGRDEVFEFCGDNGLETLPVELSSFTVSVTAQNFVQLQWVSETETNMLGYNVYRGNDNSLTEAGMISPNIIPATNTSEKQTYTFQDGEVLPGRTYFYWLQTIDLDLTNTFHGPISITLEEEEEVVPPVYVTGLEQNYPNPFNPSTLIKYSVKEDTEVSLTIYNVLGQEVKKLADGHREAGDYKVAWNGTDNNGKSVTSGIYFYRLTTDHYNKIYKMMLVK